ncbi:MAG: futalosine hydrolase [Desulfovibrionales bacterium]|nr:futalosine hydrolase [Desulfovibrionales bacterium]
MIVLACATAREALRTISDLAPTPSSWPARVSIRNRDFLICVVGIGPVAAALSIGALLQQPKRISGILNLGICGSFELDAIPMGRPCVAQSEIWPEYGVHFSGSVQEEPFAHQMLPDLVLTPPNRLDLAPAAAAAAMNLHLPADWAMAPSLTVAGVSGDEHRAAELRTRYAGGTENMEGFSLALAARRQALPFLEIRTVSNAVGVRDKGSWDFRMALDALGKILPTLLGDPS